MVFQGTRIVVPASARKQIKEYLHLPHLGQKLTHQAGALRYWWPGDFREEIYKMVADCQTCSIYAPSRQREPEAEERYQPRAPMDMIATDLFEIKGTHYLVVLDLYTGFPWYKRFNKVPDTPMVTEALNDIFLVWGYPRHIRCNSGCQYRGDFKRFCKEMYITDHTTSAFNHESNGEAEKAVSRVKDLMKKIAHAKGDFRVAFSRLRDAPMSNSKMSPARLMFRRTLRFPGLPILPDGVDEVVAGEEMQARKVVAKEKRNSKALNFGRAVVELEEGLHVLLQDDTTKLFNIEGHIVLVGGAPTSKPRTRGSGPRRSSETEDLWTTTLDSGLTGRLPWQLLRGRLAVQAVCP